MRKASAKSEDINKENVENIKEINKNEKVSEKKQTTTAKKSETTKKKSSSTKKTSSAAEKKSAQKKEEDKTTAVKKTKSTTKKKTEDLEENKETVANLAKSKATTKVADSKAKTPKKATTKTASKTSKSDLAKEKSEDIKEVVKIEIPEETTETKIDTNTEKLKNNTVNNNVFNAQKNKPEEKLQDPSLIDKGAPYFIPNTYVQISQEAKENQEIENKKNNALLKNEDINVDKLNTIKDEIKKSKKASKEKVKNSSFRKKIQRNLLICIIVTLYFIFIDLGINSIPVTVYMVDLKTFTIFIAIIAIVIFEKAYKKSDGSIATHGIEMSLIGVETLLLLQLYAVGYEFFNYVLLGITLGMIVYYLVKCLIIYIRYKVSGK